MARSKERNTEVTLSSAVNRSTTTGLSQISALTIQMSKAQASLAKLQDSET